MLVTGWKGGAIMSLIHTIYCPRCAKLQGVRDWMSRDTLVLELDLCHVISAARWSGCPTRSRPAYPCPLAGSD